MATTTQIRNLLVGGNWFGWFWVGWYTVLGVGILVFAIIDKLNTGHGAALLLVGATIFFFAVFPSLKILRTSKNKLPIIAGVLTAAFVYVGTTVTLASENSSLLGVIYLSTIYVGVLVALPIAVIAKRLRQQTRPPEPTEPC